MTDYRQMIASAKAWAEGKFADEVVPLPTDLVRDLASALEVVLSQRNAMTQLLNAEVMENQERRQMVLNKLTAMRNAPSLKAIADELIATVRGEQS
jgi:hypothetical protein